MAESIEKLRIYQSAVELEDQVYALTKALPKEQYYPLGDGIRRASAAVSHHIHQAHERYAYRLKLDELEHTRRAAEQAQRLLGHLAISDTTTQLIQGYTGVIKQSWGLTKYLRQRLDERPAEAAQTGDKVAVAQAS